MRKNLLFSFLFLGLLAPAIYAPLAAQQTCMAGPTMPEEKAATLPPPQHLSGIGNATIEITTSSEEARAWFTQGLNLLHDFWDYESVRAFQASVKADPQCGMCFWGLYRAQNFRGSNDAAAKAALDTAEKLSKHATKAEQLYIQAARADSKDKGPSEKDKKNDNDKHKDAKSTKLLRKLVTMRPNEIEAQIALAGSLMDGFKKNGDPRAGTAEGQQLLATILLQHPEDSAANHYWIHAVEPGNHPELALESARKLGALAPASGHMVHMPGHIFYRTGDYESARASFVASMQTDEAYMKAQNVSPNDDWNYVHNMMYLIADLLEAGRITEATATSGKLNHARGDTKATLYLFSTRDGLTRLNVALPVALRSGDWGPAAAMLQKAHPDPALTNLTWLRGALLEYTLGMKALEDGNTVEATKRRDTLDAALKSKPDEPAMASMPMPAGGPSAKESKDMVRKPAHTFMDIAATELRGSILMAQGKSAEADEAFKKAAAAEVDLGYREPPYYIRPVGETRGDALLRASRFADARLAYLEALKERPNSGYPLYGIARSDAAAQNTAAATVDYAAFLTAWARADPTLPQVVEARVWLSAHAGVAAAE